MSRSRSGRPRNIFGLATLGVMLVVTAVLVAMSIARVQADSNRVADHGPLDFSTATEAPPEPAPALDVVLARLSDEPDKPFVISILGDSTGVSSKGWQRLTAQWLGERTGRPVVFRQWSQEAETGNPDAYYPPEEMADGEGAPIEIWNGSAGGRNWDYTGEHLVDLVPAEAGTVDLFFVNHGHNISPADDYYYVGVPMIDTLLDEHEGSTAVLTKQNPESDASGKADVLVQVLSYVDGYAQKRQLEVIDVFSAFEATGRADELVDATGLHPTPEGYAIWFEVVKGLLEPLMPAA